MQPPAEPTDDRPGQEAEDVGATPGVDRAELDDAPSTVLAEVLPGIAVVYGEVPAGLELVDLGLVPTRDRELLSTALAISGAVATAGSTVGSAVGQAQGLYRLTDASMQLLRSGGTLAAKDGAQLGTIMRGGKIVGQARLVPVAALNPVTAAAVVGPALAMVALQMKLSEISGLIRTALDLTDQVLAGLRREQWAELRGLVAAVDGAVRQATEVGAVPSSLWDTVAGTEADLRKQMDLYRGAVVEHVKQLDRREGKDRRQYLETNAEAVVFDAHALLAALKAWASYQALRAGRARTAGTDDEARLVDVVTRDARQELAAGLATTTTLVGALTRELQLVAELPGRAGLPLGQKRKDARAARLTCAQLLEAVRPLADALRPQAPPPQEPDVVCAPPGLDPAPYLRVLRWLLDDGETLRCLAFPYRLDELGKNVALLGRLDPERWAAVVAVTDRRVLTARPGDLREHGTVAHAVPLDQVRYVRAATSAGRDERASVDLITRDENVRWLFHADTPPAQVDALAAVLAAAMVLPDEERAALASRGERVLVAGTGTEPREGLS